MNKKHEGLLILNISKVCEGSESHNDFAAEAAAEMLCHIHYTVDRAYGDNNCVPCALLSMTATLMGNIFLLYEDRTKNSPESLTKVLNDMVDLAKSSAAHHLRIEEQVSKAETKLDVIYSARKS